MRLPGTTVFGLALGQGKHRHRERTPWPSRSNRAHAEHGMTDTAPGRPGMTKRKCGWKPPPGTCSRSVSLRRRMRGRRSWSTWAIRSCCTCILPKRFWSARGLHRKRWRKFLWRRAPGRRTGCTPLQAQSCPGLRVRLLYTVTQNERLAACGERGEADPPASNPWYSPSLRGLRIKFVYQGGPYGLKLRGQLGMDLE